MRKCQTYKSIQFKDKIVNGEMCDTDVPLRGKRNRITLYQKKKKEGKMRRTREVEKKYTEKKNSFT